MSTRPSSVTGTLASTVSTRPVDLVSPELLSGPGHLRHSPCAQAMSLRQGPSASLPHPHTSQCRAQSPRCCQDAHGLSHSRPAMPRAYLLLGASAWGSAPMPRLPSHPCHAPMVTLRFPIHNTGALQRGQPALAKGVVVALRAWRPTTMAPRGWGPCAPLQNLGLGVRLSP